MFYLGISILTQLLLMNLESFLHGARELMMDMETISVVYLSLPGYLTLAPTDLLGLPMDKHGNQLSDHFVPETGDILRHILLRMEKKETLSNG